MLHTRKTLSAHAICKNEINHIADWYKNVSSICDEVVIVDTGSTDGTLEWLKEKSFEDKKLKLYEFEWVKDFSAARNFALSKVKTDYALFIDLDDRILETQAFLQWRDNAMDTADFWFAVYRYAGDCEFARERVFKTNLGLKWEGFIHEGVPPSANGKQIPVHYATSWKVTHLRSDDDLKKDRSRNIDIIEHHKAKGELSSRMLYYYGKELFESDKPLDAYPALLEAASRKDLEIHDRILAVQYAALSAMRLNQFEKTIALAHQGMQLSPNRAEFYVVAGDGYLKLNRMKDAIPLYFAAKNCIDPESNGAFKGAIFTHKDSYGRYPSMQLARVFFNMGDMIRAEKEIVELKTLYPDNAEVKELDKEFTKVKKVMNIPKIGEVPEVDEIVISCAPGGLYEWDEAKLKERGMGGSEIAAICMARELYNLTGKTVRVFNSRSETLNCNGVVYTPVNQLPEYMSKQLPKLHIAWRHNIKVTNAKTVLWCHDLWAAGIENTQNYEKVAVLSPFHKKYVQGLFGIPDDKIFLTANGVANAERFKPANKKREFKIVYASSPDRGLEHVIAALDLVVAQGYLVELHVFYGVENMITMGKGAEAQKYLDMIQSRRWIINHGNTLNTKLPEHYEDACMWLYPTTFQETFCINSLEMVLAGVYPIFRNYGAVPDTLSEFVKKGMAEGHDAEPSDAKFWSERVIEAIKDRKWEKIRIDNQECFTWNTLAKSWCNEFKL